jgi:protein involved in polysaccharide export with SLBB domain
MIRRAAAVLAALLIGAIPVLVAAAPLRSGDRVGVTIFNHPDLTIPQGTIDADGKIALPLVGNVSIAGLEPDAAADRISGALKPYLRRPSVTVSVLQQNATIAIVGGPVSSVAYVPGMTLAGVALSESTAPGLDMHHVRIDRDGTTMGTYDAQSLAHGGQGGPALEPGDTVVFALKPIAVNVSGDVKSPGIQYVDRNQTIADAVNEAGLGDNAAVGALDLVRDGVHTRVALSSTAALQQAQDGDAVSVPQAVLVAVGGTVVKPGLTALTNGTTLVAAIYQAGGPMKYGDISHTHVLHDGTEHVYDVARAFQGDASQNPHLDEGDIVSVPESKHVNLGDIFGGIGVLHLFW